MDKEQFLCNLYKLVISNKVDQIEDLLSDYARISPYTSYFTCEQVAEIIKHIIKYNKCVCMVD